MPGIVLRSGRVVKEPAFHRCAEKEKEPAMETEAEPEPEPEMEKENAERIYAISLGVARTYIEKLVRESARLSTGGVVNDEDVQRALDTAMPKSLPAPQTRVLLPRLM
jgi:hypothetical protein